MTSPPTRRQLRLSGGWVGAHAEASHHAADLVAVIAIHGQGAAEHADVAGFPGGPDYALVRAKTGMSFEGSPLETEGRGEAGPSSRSCILRARLHYPLVKKNLPRRGEAAWCRGGGDQGWYKARIEVSSILAASKLQRCGSKPQSRPCP